MSSVSVHCRKCCFQLSVSPMKQPSKLTIKVGWSLLVSCLIQLGFQTNSASPKRCFAKDGGLFQDHRSTSHLRRAADVFFRWCKGGMGSHSHAAFFRVNEGEELAILAPKIRVLSLHVSIHVYPLLYKITQWHMSNVEWNSWSTVEKPG